MAAAWQAKYHRLAALMLAGGAGLVTCITFVWFSAPDLALTQLVVEVVTTVLILLGLRWLPERDEDLHQPLPDATCAARSRAACATAAVAWPPAPAWPLLAYAMLTPPVPAKHLVVFSRARPAAKAAAPTWST